MGERLRNFDWANNPLGPAEHWPNGLKTAVRIMLTTRQPIWIGWGPELIFLYNDPYRSILGGKHPAMLGRPTRVVWSEIWGLIEPLLVKATTTDEGVYLEDQLLIMERNGYPEETYYTFSYSPLPDDHGGTGGMICTNVSDTQRVLAERQMSTLRAAAAIADARTAREAAQRSVAALDTNPQDIPFALLYLGASATGQFTLVGSLGLEAGGPCSPAEMHAGEAACWPVRTVIESGQPQIVALETLPAVEWPAGGWTRPPDKAAVLPLTAAGDTGQEGVLIVGLNPFRLVGDDYRRFLGLLAGQVAANIAGADAYEQEKRRAESLAELDRAKTAFFSNVSHEFRTPLTLMLGPLEDLLRSAKGGLSPAATDELTMVHRNGLRLLRLVNTLLDFSRIEAGRAQVAHEAVDLPVFTAEIASTFRSAIEKAGMRLTVACPPIATPGYVDRDMWEKIVLNLISNAYKYTLQGEIRVETQELGGSFELSVSDTGTGIPAEAMPHLFERFYRVENAGGRTHEGTGIGLALVAELVRMHGGTVRADSTLGVGSRFTVAIPLGRAHLPGGKAHGEPASGRRAEPASAHAFVAEASRWLDSPVRSPGISEPDTRPAAASTPASQPEATILLADDNADMREYIERLFADKYRVVSVADGEAALAEARRNPPDLVLSDVMMPRLDGIGLVKALRADPRLSAVPIILLSARAGEEARVGGLDTGADDYLFKPFSARELLARVASYLELARVRRASGEALRESEARQREIAAALAEEREKLEAVIEHLPVGVAIGDTTGATMSFNRAGLALHGFATRADMLSSLSSYQQEFELRYPDGQPVPLEDWPFGRARRGEHVREIELVLVNRRAGTSFHVAYSVVPVKREGEGPGHLVYVMQDLTGAKRAEEALRQAHDAAQAANRAKDKFIAVLSHELRTPLSPVSLALPAMEADPDFPARFRGDLAMIRRNIALEVNLIDDLLDLSRIMAGKLRLEPQPVRAHELLRHAIQTTHSELFGKRVRMIEQFSAGNDRLQVDPVRLQQVFWNLLRNAFKFTRDNGAVTIRTADAPAGDRLLIEIADDGIGIEPAQLQRIFDAFEQGENAKARQFGGLGLGLAIAKAIVEVHGGKISAQSEGVDRGARFVIELPTSKVTRDPAPEKVADEGAGPALPGLRILLVEDHPDTARTLSHMLQRTGWKVSTANTVQHALQLAALDTFDLVVSDIGLPDASGYELMQELRNRYGLRGVAMSGYGMDEDIRMSRESGFAEHITKPAHLGRLRAAIQRVMAGASV